MSKIALYRKYRPFNFSNVYGQDVIVKTLENAIKFNSINHSYIFSGPRGSGKTSIAKIFSRAINCLNIKDNFDTCGICEGCVNSNSDNSLDIIELDAASNNGVNEIRNIINSVSFVPNSLKYKVYIIDEAHMLTISAWNALLKTLEEPPQYVVFIFATTEYNKIPATIISRCQRFDFSRLSDNVIKNLLNNICEKENIKIDQNSINIIASLSEGAARDAISILDQLTSFSNDIKESDVNDIFGLVNIHNKINLLNWIINQDIESIITFLNHVYEKGVNFSLLISDIIKIIFDKLIFSKTNSDLYLKMLDSKMVSEIANIDDKSLSLIMNHLSNSLYKISISNDKLFETQMILLEATEINKNILSNTNIKKEDDKYTLDDAKTNNNKNPVNSSNIDPFSTSVRLVNEPIVKKSFVPPRPETNLNSKVIEKETNNILEQSNNIDIGNQSKIIEAPLQKSNIDIKDSFFRIAHHNDNKIKEDMNSIFLKSQENRLIETPTINKLLIAKKFLVCSNNGAILLFENARQADIFNSSLNDGEIKSWINKNFKKPILIVGIDKIYAKELSDEFKKIDTSSYEDVKIVENNKAATKNLILDILSE